MASIMAFINPKTSTPLKKFDASSLHKKKALKSTLSSSADVTRRN